MKNILTAFILYFICCPHSFADNSLLLPKPTVPINMDTGQEFQNIDELSERIADNTQCATAAFADGLASTVGKITQTDSETVIQEWIYNTFSNPDVLKKVVQCPEITNSAEDDTITFLPIKYTFPAGREIVVNYETQPKILKQRITLGNKRNITDNNPSPRIGGTDDDSIWTNTDPAWYGIMVVESGALDTFVGNGKNNTISLDYIEENIDSLYPSGLSCTSKSALATDDDMINVATTNAVGLKDIGEDDSNDYYVAGDVNLQWISYLEIGLDVVLTVFTAGGWTAITGATKAARASRTLKTLSTTLRTLSKADTVRDYVKLTNRAAKAAAELKTIDKAKDAAKYASKLDEVNDIARKVKTLENTDDKVKQFKKASETFSDLNKYRRTLRGIKNIKQRGNILARTLKSAKAAWGGGRKLNKAAKVARSGMKSGKIKDMLFQSTLRNAGALTKLGAKAGILVGTLKFVGGMYDWTETSTGDFTNGIEFKPLLLLSADDLEGQENTVNYGMWFMWLGDAVNPADDDAAYLQAMDFAAKFAYSLNTVQEKENLYPCNVDIFVVRPVLRNPGSENPAMYYLIMNDEPWTTSE